MKTLTEFTVSHLKSAAEKRQELTTAGKTPEELPAALGEVLKLEGDKLNFVIHSLEAVEGKSQNLKRVVVLSLAEGEKAPGGAVQKGDHYYMLEYYPPLPGERPAKSADGRRGGRGDKRGDKRGGKGRGDRGNRGPGGPGGFGGRGPRRDENTTQAGAEGAPPSEGGRPPRNRGPRQPRAPRPEGAPQKQLAPGERLPLPKPLHPDKLLNKTAQTSAPAAEQSAPTESPAGEISST